MLKKIKAFFKSKGFTFGTTTIIMTAALIGILLIINILVEASSFQLDLTQEKRNSISKESINYLKSVKKDIKMLFIINQEPPLFVKNILDQYKKNSSNIKVQYINPDKEPVLASKYFPDSKVENASLVIESGKKQKIVSLSDSITQDQQTGAISSKVEQRITTAISFVNEEKEVYIYSIIGHGETQTASLNYVKDALNEMYYNMKELNLLTVNEIPKDATMIVEFGPKSDITPDEKSKIEKYLESGGRMLYFAEPIKNNKFNVLSNYNQVFENYNIVIDNSYIIETDVKKVAYDRPNVLVPDIQDTEITSTIISKNMNVILPGVTSLSISKNLKQGVNNIPLAKTSEKSWAKKNISSILSGKASKDTDDLQGPLNVALSAEKQMSEDKSQKTRILVYGNNYFLSDEIIANLGATGNTQLFVNSVKWLAERKDTLVINEKTIKNYIFAITASQFYNVFIIIILIPILFSLLGLFIWLRRKRL